MSLQLQSPIWRCESIGPLGDRARRMGTRSRLLTALLLFGVCAVTLPSCSSDNSKGVDPAGKAAGEEAAELSAKASSGTDGQRDIEAHFNRIGVSGETLDRIRNHLVENGFTDNQIEPTLGGMLRVVYKMRSEGEDFELDPRLRTYFGEIGLTDEQIELVQGLARRIVHGLGDSERQRGEGE